MEESNSLIIRLGMVGFFLFVISFFKSCTELKYYMGKQEAIARVTKIYEEEGRRGRHVGWHISYSFRNETTDEMQRGYVIVDDESVDYFSVGQEIPVEYRGDSQFDSRIKGDTNTTWVYIFIGSLIFTVGSVAFLSWQSMREENKGRRRR